jgi:hypothetical protein
MPYPFAHPAAILPLLRPLGRHAAPSALAIGSMVPDAWYFVPEVVRADSHSLEGLFGFCLPAGVLGYLAFHLLLKQPLLSLLPEKLASRLQAFCVPGLPPAGWPAVLGCLLAGAATHIVWDALAHAHRVLQHGSTLIGGAIVAAWLWRRVARAAPQRCASLPPRARAWIIAALAAASAGWALWVAALEPLTLPHDVVGLRHALRTAGLAAVQALGVSAIGYAILWKLCARIGYQSR